MRVLMAAVAASLLLNAVMAVSGPNEVVRVDRDNDAHALLNRADSAFQGRDYEAARELYVGAYELAEKEFNPSVLVEASAQVARMHILLDDKESGRPWLALAAERATKADPHGWSRYLSVRARFEWKDEDLAAAKATLIDMYEYCRANALWGRAVDAANLLGIITETAAEQKEWITQGIAAAEAADEGRWLGPLWNNLASIYFDEAEFDSALNAYLNAREYHWRHSGEIGKLYADYHVGMTYRKLGDFDQAASWLRPVLAWAERLDNASAIGQASEDLGEVMIAQGDHKDGLALLERALEMYKKAGLDESWPDAYTRLVDRVAELQG